MHSRIVKTMIQMRRKISPPPLLGPVVSTGIDQDMLELATGLGE